MKAHEILSSPDKWTQHTLARTADGTPTWVSDPSATCFCTFGALILCYTNGKDHMEKKKKLTDKIGIRFETVGEWNDQPERTFEEVHALLKELDI